jgi:hypothetical protein
MRMGSARVWRRDQRLDSRRDALLADLCVRIFEEKIFSRKADKKALSSGPRRISYWGTWFGGKRPSTASFWAVTAIP